MEHWASGRKKIAHQTYLYHYIGAITEALPGFDSELVSSAVHRQECIYIDSIVYSAQVRTYIYFGSA